MEWTGQAFRFDLVDLRLFVNVAELDSLSRGAGRSNISLAAASTRIKNLELNLGVQLFNRRSRGVTLTGPGHTFLGHAIGVLKQLEQLSTDLQQYSSGRRGQIRIGANITCLAEVIPNAMRAFLARHPGIAVELLYYRSKDGLRALMDDAIDIALVSFPVEAPGLRVIPLGHESSVLITGKDHPLSRQTSASFSEILSYEMIGFGNAKTLHPEYARFAKELRKSLNYRIHVNNFEDLCQLVSDGIGISIIPRSVALRYLPVMDLRILSVAEPWACRELNLCLRHPRTLPSFVDDLVGFIEHSAFDTITAPGEEEFNQYAEAS